MKMKTAKSYTPAEIILRADAEPSAERRADANAEGERAEGADSGDFVFDVVYATPTPVIRYDWERGQRFNEVLEISADAIDTTRLDAGANLLDTHNRWSISSILGVVTEHRIEKGKGFATIKMSKRPELESLRQDIKDGIVRHISVGYSVSKYRMEAHVEGEMPTYTAIRWSPAEISFVPVPADPQSQKRMQDGAEGTNSGSHHDGTQQLFETEVINEKSHTIMDPKETAAEALATEARATEAATKAERLRIAEINGIATKAGLAGGFAARHIDAGTALDAVRTDALKEMESRQPALSNTNPSAAVGKDRERERFIEVATSGVVLRSGQIASAETETRKDRELYQDSQIYRSMKLSRLAEVCLRRTGVDTSRMSDEEIIGRAITSNSSDFPILLEGTNRRILLAAYTATPDTWREFCSTGSVTDFREHWRLRDGSLGDLQKVDENGEYKTLSIGDAEREKISVNTYGNIINVSRKMIVNDDLSAFTSLATKLGRSAARTIEKAVYALLTSNSGVGPTMNDGLALFHATHGNIASAAAPAVAVFEAMRVQMAQQMDVNSNDYLDVRPNLGLFPLALAGGAKILNGSQYDPDATNKLQKPNLVNGLLSNIIDSPRLSGTRYYMFADPAQNPTIEVAFLNGVQTPYLDSEEAFTQDGMRWKIRHDFGVAAVGWRGAITNAGA